MTCCRNLVVRFMDNEDNSRLVKDALLQFNAADDETSDAGSEQNSSRVGSMSLSDGAPVRVGSQGQGHDGLQSESAVGITGPSGTSDDDAVEQHGRPFGGKDAASKQGGEQRNTPVLARKGFQLDRTPSSSEIRPASLEMHANTHSGSAVAAHDGAAAAGLGPGDRTTSEAKASPKSSPAPFSPDVDDMETAPAPPDKCILVVDDSYPMLKMLSFALTREGIEVTGAQGGETALDFMKANHYDAVLVDLNMPKMDGFQLAYALRKHEMQRRTGHGGSGSGSAGKDSPRAGTSAPTNPAVRSDPSAGGGEGGGGGGGAKVPKEDDAKAAGDGELIPFVASITASCEDDHEPRQRLLLIGMSSDQSPEIMLKVAECGMDLFLKKPFTAAAVKELMMSSKLGSLSSVNGGSPSQQGQGSTAKPPSPSHK